VSSLLAGEIKSSFGPDYYFSAADSCNFKHSPALAMADDLAADDRGDSPRRPGDSFFYCAESVAALKYKEGAFHSMPTCTPATVAWEAKLSGFVSSPRFQMCCCAAHPINSTQPTHYEHQEREGGSACC